jgi:hypothetical protein
MDFNTNLLEEHPWLLASPQVGCGPCVGYTRGCTQTEMDVLAPQLVWISVTELEPLTCGVWRHLRISVNKLEPPTCGVWRHL